MAQVHVGRVVFRTLDANIIGFVVWGFWFLVFLDFYQVRVFGEPACRSHVAVALAMAQACEGRLSSWEFFDFKR